MRLKYLVNANGKYDYRFEIYKVCYALESQQESQQQVVCDEVVKRLNGSLRFFEVLSPTDLQAIGYYIIANTSQPITDLSLYECHYNDDRIRILLGLLSPINLCKLNNLDIPNTIYGREVDMLVNILKSATNLCEVKLNIMDISHNEAEMQWGGGVHSMQVLVQN